MIHFDDLIENLYGFKISDDDKFFELLQKFKTKKYFQSRELTPVTGSPLITREKILKECKLILNVSEDVTENLSNELFNIYNDGEKGLSVDKVKKHYPDYDYHLPFPDINFFISFPSKKFPLEFKLDKGEYLLKGIYIKSSLVEGRIEYKIFLLIELYSDSKMIGKFLNFVPFTQKDFIQQDKTKIILAAHVMSYIFLKGITDCYLAGVREKKEISFKNQDGQQVKLKYPSSVIVYRHKQYEPPEASGIKYDFYKGRNVIGHYRHFYVKTPQGKRIVDQSGHWMLDKMRPEGGGKDEFGNRPGTDFFKGRTYVKPHYNDLEHNDFVRKYIKMEGEGNMKRSLKVRKNPKMTSEDALETISPMTHHYLVTALWAETDYDGEPLDSNYELEDIDADFILEAEKDCQAFMKKALHLFTEEELEDEEAIGHNFWLNRHGHGAGFWDGDYEKGDELSDIADSFGQVYIQEALEEKPKKKTNPVSFSNKAAFTPEMIDYADYIINGKKLDQNTCIKFISHKFPEVKGLDAYALYKKVKKDTEIDEDVAIRSNPKKKFEIFADSGSGAKKKFYGIRSEGKVIEHGFTTKKAAKKHLSSIGKKKNPSLIYDSKRDEYIDDQGRVVDKDKYAEWFAEELYAVTDLAHQDVYLTEVDEDVAIRSNPKKPMTKSEYVKKYNKLWKKAETLPRVEAIKKLEEASRLKKKYFSSIGKKKNPSLIDGPVMTGEIMWISQKDENGVIIKDGDEHYFDISVTNTDFQKLKRKDRVSFRPSRVSGVLVARDVEFLSRANPSFKTLNYKEADKGFSEAEKILETFFKNCDSKDQAIKKIMKNVRGELPEFTAKGLKGYMAYGNREALIYVHDIEEPFVLHVDVYGDKPILVWG
jgi:hypothetical protein